MTILNKIQTELKAPKSQRNNFGKYNYRSCEDILEAVKPLLKKYDATLIIADDIVLIGNRYYVKATATLTSADGANTATAFAREEETRKGMDASQITGSASSYARKYALNGLFAIDDTKDADTRDNREIKVNTDETEKPTNITLREIIYNELSKAKNKDELGKISRKLFEAHPELKQIIIDEYNAKLAEFLGAVK